MALDSAAATAAATIRADALIAAYHDQIGSIPGIRDKLIASFHDDLMFVFDAIVVHRDSPRKKKSA